MPQRWPPWGFVTSVSVLGSLVLHSSLEAAVLSQPSQRFAFHPRSLRSSSGMEWRLGMSSKTDGNVRLNELCVACLRFADGVFLRLP